MTLDALIAATRPILNAHGLAISQLPTMVKAEGGEWRPALRTRISHVGSQHIDVAMKHVLEQGESIEDTMPLYLTDKTMQGLGSAITYARRYAWASALGIAAEEDTDAAPMPQEDIPF